MANIRKYKKKNGDIVYRAEVRIKGYEPIRRTFPKKSLAQDWAGKIEAAMHDGSYKDLASRQYRIAKVIINGEEVSVKIEFVDELIDFYKDYIAAKKYALPEKYNPMYSWWKENLRKTQINEYSYIIEKTEYLRVCEIDSEILSNCKNILMTETIVKKGEKVNRSNNTINKYLMCMSAVLTYATNELNFFDYNPMSKINALPKKNKAPRFLSDEEIDSLKTACKDYSQKLYLFFMILLKTGARFNEVRHLKVKDLDYKNERVYYLETKNNSHRGVHLDIKILKEVKEYIETNKIDEGYIFKSTKRSAELSDMKGALEQAIRNAKVKSFRIHDIRHTTASILAKEGASLLEIAIILGQTSLTVTRNYSHLTQKHTELLLASVMDKY